MTAGHDLTQSSPAAPKEPSFDEKIAKIQKYLPSGITEKILSQRDRIEGERKQVTVLFTDMAGYTPLSEKLDPEDDVQNDGPDLRDPHPQGTEYGGTVNELTGDGIMALFGAPIALEDAPQRAIRAVSPSTGRWCNSTRGCGRRRANLPPLRMRAGIHTGPVVVGTVGNDLRVDFKAVGDTVNLASRMEQMAEYQKSGSYKDAIAYAKKSITCLERLPQTEQFQKKIIDTRVMLSAYYLTLGYHIEAKEAVEPIVDLAVGLNYQKRMPGIYTAIGLYYIWVEEDFSKGVPYLKDAFRNIRKGRGFSCFMAWKTIILGTAMCLDYRFKESMEHLKTSLDLMANNLTGIAVSKSAIAMNYSLQGKTDLASQTCTEALQAATESGDILQSSLHIPFME